MTDRSARVPAVTGSLSAPAGGADFYAERGYALIKGVFSLSEVSSFRRMVTEQSRLDEAAGLAYGLRAVPRLRLFLGDLLSKSLLRELLLDERVLAVARKFLGCQELIYFGDSSYQIGVGRRGFHRDNVDRADLRGVDWSGDYPLVRIGIYLQDHKDHSGGLKVRAGSHRRAGGPSVFIDSEVGDLVLWNYRVLHSGNAVRFKFSRSLSLPIGEGFIPRILAKSGQSERMSLFMGFSSGGPHLQRYLGDLLWSRPDMVKHAKASLYGAQELAAASLKGVRVLAYPRA